ncbi:FAD-dependent oxidoreductase [Piscinibacter sp.]|uniref:FAD-dependent oxidoreductase n=1 Tax=Piscinibacter sp. TaxID=1903157 RepID=UPI00355AC820
MNSAAPDRRQLLKLAAALPLMSGAWPQASAAATVASSALSAMPPFSRVRPTDPGWPTDAQWAALRQQVGEALVAVRSPWADCRAHADSAACAQLFKSPQNPYSLGDDLALTQTYGWVDAWTSSPSVWAVAARNTADVAAAVNFARTHRLRLVVKGGGHSYQGTSNAPDSLLMWTRHLNDVALHEAFVARGCEGQTAPVRAVTVGAGAIWTQVYDAVTTRGGGYVQGGGCMTVGVGGLVQSGGFGSFSKAYGLAAGSLLEAEVVTADGQVRIANACTHPDLFWALKGGGGGSFGIVTRLTLRVHPLPERFGAVNFTVRASSDAAYRRLIGLMVDFCARSLINPHWGEQLRLRGDNLLRVSMVFQGLDRSQAQTLWQPFLDAVAAAPHDYSIDFAPLKIVSTSARDFWAPTLIKRVLGFIEHDDRPGAPEGNVFWPGDQAQAGQVLHGFQSGWLSATLLRDDQRATLADALFEASRHNGLALHLNKGLAGAPPEVLAAAKDTATNPAVLDAFALVICAAEGPPAYPGVPGHEPDVAGARRRAQALRATMDALRRRVPVVGAYVSESDFFESQWQQAFWGANYQRLLAVKDRYDPDGLFVVHHGVGSERWSPDGFTRQA